jgi:small-conductance mechanosensitive channel
VTIPNTKFVDNMVMNISVRPFIRRQFDLTLPKPVTADQIEQALQIVRDVLNDDAHRPSFDASRPPKANLVEFTAASAVLRITAWFAATDQWEYQANAEKLNLQLIRKLAEANLNAQPGAI